jgi:hypothetical protein
VIKMTFNVPRRIRNVGDSRANRRRKTLQSESQRLRQPIGWCKHHIVGPLESGSEPCRHRYHHRPLPLVLARYLTASAIAWPISIVFAFPPVSRVRGPSTNILSIAFKTEVAASGSPKCSNIIAPLQI